MTVVVGVSSTKRKSRRAGWSLAPVAVAFALLVGACSSTPSDNRQVFLPDPPAQADTTPAAEREHKRILAAYGGVYQDAKLEAMISQTVDRLVAASERPDLHYKVTLLNSPAVNAFALPTGQLYVTRGLIALANDDSELASVLAHEMSHVIARHAAIREDQARQAELVSRVVNDVLSDPQTGALALAKSKIALASFSRQQEFEADGMGVGIAARAGYDPFGAARFLTSMGHNAEMKSDGAGADNSSLDFLSSHPSTPDRVKNALESARHYSAPGTGERDRGVYLASISGLVYGEDPTEGYVRGRRFLHAKLGFTFTVPEGFTLHNTAQAVLALKTDGDQALRFDMVRVPAEQSLSDYLKSGWIEHVDPTSLKDLTINGFPAATATAKGDKWTFRLYVVRFGSEVYRFIFAAKEASPESDRAFHQTVESFRRMSLAEVHSAKPLRLKIVTVRAGDTVERLAARMAIADHRIERFRVLNGLDGDAAPKPGDKVKIVAE